jgi:hypothetical protein
VGRLSSTAKRSTGAIGRDPINIPFTGACSVAVAALNGEVAGQKNVVERSDATYDVVNPIELTLEFRRCQSPSIGRGHGNIQADTYICCKGVAFMSESRDDQERPCLHCMMVELIDDFFAEYPATTGEPATIDTDEVIAAIAKTVAELTSSQNGTIRQQLVEQLMREIMNYDAEFRRDAQTGAIGSDARH